MIALFFEVLPRPGQDRAYFDMAATLKPSLDRNGGLLFLDRSRSVSRPGWFLSHQFWEDEASMVRWRANAAHHRAQVCGRTDIMADYRLRVGEVIASSRSGEVPTAAPTATDRLALSVLSNAPLTETAGEAFTSVYDPALNVTLVPAAGPMHVTAHFERISALPAVTAARLCRIIRDYGMYDRAEAPQHFDDEHFAPVTLA